MKTAKREMVTLHTCYMVGTTVRFTNPTNKSDGTLTHHLLAINAHHDVQKSNCRSYIGMKPTCGVETVHPQQPFPFPPLLYCHGTRMAQLGCFQAGQSFVRANKETLRRQPMPIQQQSMVTRKAQGDTSLYRFSRRPPDGKPTRDQVGPLGPAAPTPQMRTVNFALVFYVTDSPKMQTPH